jgi:DNA-binding CsgD family transcriptional regulator
MALLAMSSFPTDPLGNGPSAAPSTVPAKPATPPAAPLVGLTFHPVELADVVAALVRARPGDVIAVAVLATAPPVPRAAPSAPERSASVPAAPCPGPGAPWPGAPGPWDGRAVRAQRWAELSEREIGVAELAAQALTNRQIARRLCLSPHTVGYHLRQIFRKLDIQSRVWLAQLVHEWHAEVEQAAADGTTPTFGASLPKARPDRGGSTGAAATGRHIAGRPRSVGLPAS